MDYDEHDFDKKLDSLIIYYDLWKYMYTTTSSIHRKYDLYNYMIASLI